MGVKVTVSGSSKETRDFLQRIVRRQQFAALAKYGPIGVEALREATPKDDSSTAEAWTYEVIDKKGYFAIHWYNSVMLAGVPLVILLHYGHGTRGGGHVEGIDFINPALKPIFDQMADDMWKVVTR